MTGTLYIVGTPIGNLGDFSPRGRETLERVDFIAAEDTRVTRKLLSYFDIHKPLVSYFEHHRAESGEKILVRLLSGESCALVTDAGMPAISDPGEDLVRLCAEQGVPIATVPGPSAVITALAGSALSAQRFCFEGFLSTAKKSRQQHLSALAQEPRTMVFYEAPHKLLGTLADMLAAWGDRRITLCRELTKLHEEFLRTTLSGALAHFTETPPRGEFVLVIAGAPEAAAPEMTLEAALALLEEYRAAGHPLKEAARLAAAGSGFSKNTLYEKAIKKNS